MADSSNNDLWPLPKFYFKVTWGDVILMFSEVSGLDTESQIIEYRHGNSPQFSTVKMPGIKKFGNVTLKRGITTRDTAFMDWYSKINMGTVDRQTVVIELVDESESTTMSWTLNNAWPIKITGTDLKSDGNEIAIETIELAHKGLTIKNA